MLWLAAACIFLTDDDLASRRDGDGDGVPRAVDCADDDHSRHPEAVEVCNGVDDDCDGQVDEGLHPDADGDGYGSASISGACFVGWIADARDCDDADADVVPGAVERCDGAVNGCTETGEPLSEAGLATFTPASGAEPVEYGALLAESAPAAPAFVALQESGELLVCAADAPRYAQILVTDGDVRIDGVLAEGADPEDPAAWPELHMGQGELPVLTLSGAGASLLVEHLRWVGGITRSAPALDLAAGWVEFQGVQVSGYLGTEVESTAVRLRTDAEFTDVFFTGNSSWDCGGGLRVEEGGWVKGLDWTFTLNRSSTDGGGLCIDGGSVLVTGITIGGEGAGNHAKLDGAGLWVSSGGEAYLAELWIAGNTVEGGSGDEGTGAGAYSKGFLSLNCKAACAEGQGVCGNTTASTALPTGGGVVVAGGDLFVTDCELHGNAPDDLVVGSSPVDPADFAPDYSCTKSGCEASP